MKELIDYLVNEYRFMDREALTRAVTAVYSCHERYVLLYNIDEGADQLDQVFYHLNEAVKFLTSDDRNWVRM